VSDFYEVQLRQYPKDVGLTQGSRPLTNADRVNGLNVSEVDGLGLFNNGNEDVVIFNLTPTVSESRSIDYTNTGLPTSAGILIYLRTHNRQFSLSAKLVSRTVAEAAKNYVYVNTLRAWLLPQTEGGLLSSPPILRLSGYRKQFYNIPVVISDLTINYPEDVDYIQTPDAMVPIIQSVEMTLIESHRLTLSKETAISDGNRVSSSSGGNSTNDFSLGSFKLGILPGY